MASYVYVKKPNGTTYVYQNDSYWDKAEHCTVLTTGPALLLDKAVHETGIDKTLRTSFPEGWDRILTCAYYLASEGASLCHVGQWSARNRHPFHSKLADQRVSELLRRITPSAQQKFFGD